MEGMFFFFGVLYGSVSALLFANLFSFLLDSCSEFFLSTDSQSADLEQSRRCRSILMNAYYFCVT